MILLTETGSRVEEHACVKLFMVKERHQQLVADAFHPEVTGTLRPPRLMVLVNQVASPS